MKIQKKILLKLNEIENSATEIHTSNTDLANESIWKIMLNAKIPGIPSVKETINPDRSLFSAIQVGCVSNTPHSFTFSYFYPDEKSSVSIRIAPSPFITTPLHSHDYTEFTYVACGKLCIKLENSTIEINEGEFCLMGRNVQHTEINNGNPYKAFYIGISDTFLQKFLIEESDITPFNGLLLNLILNRSREFRLVIFKPISEKAGNSFLAQNCILHILEELQNWQSGTKYLLYGLAIRMISCMENEYELQMMKREKSLFREQLAADVANYVRVNCNNINIRKLGAIYHYNDDYFTRLFQEYYNCSYIEYLQSVRIGYAGHLLLSTNDSISTILEKVGYHNTGYFYKIFKQHYGMLPGEYRRANCVSK